MLSLRELKSYLQTHPRLSLAELSLALSEDQLMLQMMLQHFINNGHVKIRRRKANCGVSCQQCHFAVTDCYEWCDNQGIS